MTNADRLRTALVSVEVDATFTHAVMRFHDDSRLEFCHRVDERWTKAVGPGRPSDESGLAGTFVRAITTFRLNAKHLDIQFDDGSRWDESVRGLVQAAELPKDPE